MHIEVTGRGPDLVLIHGWALQGGVFAPLVERLADHFTLHRVDLPGHGHSRDDTTPLRLPFVVSAIAAATPPAVFEQFGRELASDFGGTLERFLALDVMGSAHAREELRTLRQRLVERGAPTERALLEGLRLLESTDLRGALPTLGTPSLWLAGQRDRLVSPAAMQAAAALAPQSQALTIAHGGHAPFLGHADEVAAALQHFVAGLSPADGGQ